MITFSKTFGEHIAHFNASLTALREAGVSLKLRIYQFDTDRILSLVHIIRPGMLEVKEAATASLNG